MMGIFEQKPSLLSFSFLYCVMYHIQYIYITFISIFVDLKIKIMRLVGLRKIHVLAYNVQRESPK